MSGAKEPKKFEGAERRIHVVAILILLAFSVLGVQFWRLQILNLNQFSEMAEANRVRQKRLDAPRGLIFGHGDVVLADNRASADIVFVPGDCPKERIPEVCQTLEALIGIQSHRLLAQVEAARRQPFSQIPVKRDVSKADRIRVEENAFALPGVYTVVQPQRRYLHAETAGQILGYLGEINQRELEEREGYNLGDLIGRTGLEQMYEEVLRGHDGFMLVTKYAAGVPQFRTDRYGVPYIAKRDSHGHLLSEEGLRQPPRPGNALYLTLDIDLQRYCDNLLKGEVGAIVVLDADTGAVYALSSTPNYDPSVFITRGRSQERQELLNESHPRRMRNRAFQEQYPPGSVFKIMMAAAAIEEGKINARTGYFCPGFYQLPGVERRWRCHLRHGLGSVNVYEALAYSCDVFFYNVGINLGIDKLSEWAHRMGMGEPTGIDLPGEIPGIIPSKEWKAQMNADKSVWEQRWYPGETVNLSIGQGGASTTPLQNAVMMACIVNGGYRVQPYLNAARPPGRSEKFLSDTTVEMVRQGLQMCVEKMDHPRGTGRRAHIPGMLVLGKTGTAQIMSLKHHEQFKTAEDIPYHMRDHAWFVAGVLDREPRISVCILIEHGHQGGEVASPYAKDVITYFYDRIETGESRTAIQIAREARMDETEIVQEEAQNDVPVFPGGEIMALPEAPEIPGDTPANSDPLPDAVALDVLNPSLDAAALELERGSE